MKFIYRLIIILLFQTCMIQPITIMVNPAGDAKQTGRKINGYFERGITLQFFEQFKQEIKKQYPNHKIRIISTRFPGETIQELQNANFSNRLQTDFYISIHFYQETKIKPDLFLYYFSYNDDFLTKKFDLQFWPYDKAHLINFDTTKHWINDMHTILNQKKYARKFTLSNVFKLPFAPLIGIVAPAIGVEIGLKNKDDWHHYIEPLIESLQPIIHELVN